jgi:cell division protein FtsN
VSRRRPGDPSRLASMLFALGCVSVLSAAFLAGVATGRHWPRWLPSLGSGATARVEREPSARKPGEFRPGDRPRSVIEPAPMLTYYQELTAPLAAPPPAKPAEKPAPAKTKPPATTTSGNDANGRSAAAPAAAAKPSGGPRYAVQVGAYKDRGPAEAMRGNLADAGWDAYLAEVEGPDAVRFRVRVGNYPTREDARAAAQRLGSERRVSTYVTVR